MSTAPRRPTVRLHDVSVSATHGMEGTDGAGGGAAADAVVAAVREAVAAAAARGTPSQEGVRSAVSDAVARRGRP